jgi:hypothetical protein
MVSRSVLDFNLFISAFSVSLSILATALPSLSARSILLVEKAPSTATVASLASSLDFLRDSLSLSSASFISLSFLVDALKSSNLWRCLSSNTLCLLAMSSCFLD